MVSNFGALGPKMRFLAATEPGPWKTNIAAVFAGIEVGASLRILGTSGAAARKDERLSFPKHQHETVVHPCRTNKSNGRHTRWSVSGAWEQRTA